MDDGAIAFSRSVMTDLPVWRELAREVEQLSGAPMAESEEWSARLKRHIDRATAWCARTGMGVPLVGGMWLSFTHPDAVTIGWLAVRRSARRRLDRGPVDHALVRTFYKGAAGTIVIGGAADPEVFSAEGEAPEPGDTDTAGGFDEEVVITAIAFDPANADNAYDPREVTVPVGTTVRWVNQDTVAHTVTSGVSDGTVGEADGLFDSSFLEEGDTFTYTFDEAGEFPYHYQPHPWMRGTVTVTES